MDNLLKSPPCADFNINFLLIFTYSSFLLNERKGAHGISGVYNVLISILCKF